jgi:hypothetical protein
MAQGRFRSAPTNHFLRELKKLPADVKARVLLAIEELVSNPFAGIRLRGELDGLFRWRTGDYRRPLLGVHQTIILGQGDSKSSACVICLTTY